MNASQKETHALLVQYCEDNQYELEERSDDDCRVDGEVFRVTDDVGTKVDLVIDDTGDIDTVETAHLLSYRAVNLSDEVIEGVYDLRDSGDPDELNFDAE